VRDTYRKKLDLSTAVEMTADTFLSLRNVSQCEMSIERGEQRKTKNDQRKTSIDSRPSTNDQQVKKRLDLSTAVEMTPDTFLSLRNVSQCEILIERGEQRKTKNEKRTSKNEHRPTS
jgi:hypothetical protein